MNLPNFLKGTNFYIAVLMLVFSFFGGNEGLAQQLVSTGVGLIATIGLVRQFLNTAKFQGFKNTLAQANTWNYIGGVVLLILPQAGDLIPAVQSVYDALITGNWGLVISRGFTLLTIVFYLVKDNGPKAAAQG